MRLSRTTTAARSGPARPVHEGPSRSKRIEQARGAPAPGFIPGPAVGGPTPYNCGQVNSNGDLGFWSKCGQKLKRCWTDTSGAVGGMFTPGQGRCAFQSDHCLDLFASPVSNPFYF